MRLLRVEDTTKYFGGVQALKSVTFAVDKQNVVGLIGPNGSGKTTLLNIIAGVERLTSGKVLLNGERIDSLPQHRRVLLGIAKANQVPQLIPNMTANENVMIAVLYGIRQEKDLETARNQAASIIHRVGLERENTMAKNLTVQEQKRLELARAVATGAEVLLLDEVFAGLTQNELRQEIITVKHIINDLKLTVIVVEHVMKAVTEVTQRILVLSEGALIADVKPDEILRDERVLSTYLGRKTL